MLGHSQSNRSTGQLDGERTRNINKEAHQSVKTAESNVLSKTYTSEETEEAELS